MEGPRSPRSPLNWSSPRDREVSDPLEEVEAAVNGGGGHTTELNDRQGTDQHERSSATPQELDFESPEFWLFEMPLSQHQQPDQPDQPDQNHIHLSNQYNAAVGKLVEWLTFDDAVHEPKELARELKTNAHELMLLLLRTGQDEKWQNLKRTAEKLLSVVSERARRPNEYEFVLLESAPLELLNRLYCAVAGDLDQFLQPQCPFDKMMIDAAGRLKGCAQWLMLQLLREGRLQDGKLLLAEAGALLEATRRRANHSSAPELNLLEPAPEELLKRLAFVLHDSAVQRLNDFVTLGIRDWDKAIALADEVRKWSQWVMVSHLEQVPPGPAEAVMTQAQALLGHAQAIAGQVARQFDLLHEAPKALVPFLVEASERLRSRDRALVVPLAGEQPQDPSLMAADTRKRTHDAFTMEHGDAVVIVGAVQPRPAFAARLNKPAKDFIETLLMSTESGAALRIRQLFVKLQEKGLIGQEEIKLLAVCGTAGILRLEHENARLVFTHRYLAGFCKLKHGVQEAIVQNAILGPHTPRSVVHTLRTMESRGEQVHKYLKTLNLLQRLKVESGWIGDLNWIAFLRRTCPDDVQWFEETMG